MSDPVPPTPSTFTDLERPPLSTAGLRRALVQDGPWAALEVVASTGSTNADLLAAAAEGAPGGTVLLAEHQGAGRGRHVRSWSSPARAGLAVSVLLRPPAASLARLGWLPLLTGVAVVDVLRRVAEVDAELKWPNDVLVGGRKVAGILAQVVQTMPAPAVVVGLGLNVSLRADELPVPEATSLMLLGAACTDRDTLARAVLRELGERVRAWERGDGDLAGDYRARCATLGQQVRVLLAGEQELLGTAVDVDAGGRLLVRTVDGAQRAVSAGDVTHLRLAGR